MRKKSLSATQKRIAQQLAFQRKLKHFKNIDQASNACFSLLAGPLTQGDTTSFLYMFKNFLELPQSRNIMTHRYKKNTIDIFNMKSLPFSPSDIKTTIIWLCEVFCYFNQELNEFIKAKEAITNDILLSNFKRAKEDLQNFTFKHGTCRWTITTELSLLYFQNDVPEYKEKTKELNNINHALSQSFLSYEAVRCNPLITAERYKFSIGKMLEEVKLNGQSELEQTIKYRHDFDPCDTYSNLDFIFSNCCEERIFDMYNSFKRFICYKYNSGENLSEIAPFIKKIIDVVDDDEINIIYKRILGKQDESDDKQYNEIINSYINNDYEKVIQLSESLLKEKPFFSVVYLPYTKSLIRKGQATKLPGPLGEIIKLSCNLFSNTDFNDSLKKLNKIYYVLLHHDWIHIIGCILESLDGSDGINNSQRYNFVDSILLTNNKLSFRDSRDFKWLDDVKISEWRRKKIKADKHFYDGEYDLALSLYRESLSKTEPYYIDELKSKIIFCHFSIGDHTAAITKLSELLQNGANPRTLPIKVIAEHIAINGRYKTNNDELYNEAIILNAFNKNILAKYIQHTSNICENFLENINITSNEQLRFSDENIPDFFLTDLLSIDVLEGMISIIESEVDVLLTRLEIDRYIVMNENNFDDITVKKSKNEINNIFYKLIVQSCSNEAGEGRIYVDKSSLKARMLNDIEKELLSLKEYDNKIIHTYKEMTDDDGVEYHSASTPFMRDLFDLIMKISDGYTIDKLYGIDQSLNVGIRHGGIVNLLWAPLKNNGIAAHKSKDGKFIPNPAWRHDYGYYNQEVLDLTDKHLVILNENLNTIINSAKDKVHINTGEFLEENKIFNYNTDMEIIYEIAENIDKIDGETLIDLIFDYLDDKTEECLDYAKNTFIPALRNEMNETLLSAKEEIKIENVNRLITQSKNQVDESIDFLQSWFNWSGTSKTSFTFKAAIEKSKLILNKLHPWQSLRLLGDSHIEKFFLGKHFTSIVTLLTLIFENVVKHGDTSDLSEIDIKIDEKPDSIKLSFHNKVQNPFSSEDAEKFNRINELLDTEYETYSAKETGSGIFKIKKILTLELKCKNQVYITPTSNSFGITICILNDGDVFE
ncbi:hypothetical protein [Plesiomonas shigelloides]|uniref:hypothetical protein n=1 Tax=Plesiomonas shigelloides TaxID=703 RepID=UPI0012616592|nr:hypothetical protein [Plesiomonas shigelloides]KAB7669750.1 hypothetical protein GBN18_06145 [Plesiomonas shigelloides]